LVHSKAFFTLTSLYLMAIFYVNSGFRVNDLKFFACLQEQGLER
jgi:hypothetical protein